MQADLEELKGMLSTAKRPNTKQLLEKEIYRLEAEVHRQAGETKPSRTPVSTTAAVRSRTKIDLYGWGQSDKFVNLYVSDKLKDLKGLPQENVTSTFTERSVQLDVKDLNGRDYYFTITNLCAPINPADSHHKLKADSVVLNLRKTTTKEWPCVTAAEKAIKDKKAAKDDDATKLASQDPQASLMGMMKKMYEDGDDDMKRTIAKAWTESSEKKSEMGADAHRNAMMGM